MLLLLETSPGPLFFNFVPVSLAESASESCLGWRRLQAHCFSISFMCFFLKAPQNVVTVGDVSRPIVFQFRSCVSGKCIKFGRQNNHLKSFPKMTPSKPLRFLPNPSCKYHSFTLAPQQAMKVSRMVKTILILEEEHPCIRRTL